MCKTLLLFRIPFYTHVLTKIGFYRCTYRECSIKHKLFPSQSNTFLVLLVFPTKAQEARAIQRLLIAMAAAPWNNSTIPSQQCLGTSATSNEVSKYHDQNEKSYRQQGKYS